MNRRTVAPLSRPCLTALTSLLLLSACGGETKGPAVSPSVATVAPGSASASREPAPRMIGLGDQAPATEKRPVREIVHGVTFVDDYAWLRNAKDPAVLAWIEEQNRHTTTAISRFSHLEELRAQMRALRTDARPPVTSLVRARGGFFGLHRDPKAQQPSIVFLTSLDDLRAMRVVVDPNVLDDTGATAIDWFVVSPDGKRVAASLSVNGSEDGSLYVFDAATGRPLEAPLPRVQYPTAGGSAAFTPDGSGIFYTRMPAPGERPEEELHFHQQLYFHKFGRKSEEDVRVLGEPELSRIAEVHLSRGGDDKTLVASVNIGDGARRAFYVHRHDAPPSSWTKVVDPRGEVHQVAVDGDGVVWGLTFGGAPRGKIVRFSSPSLDAASAAVIVPEGPEAVDHFAVTRRGIFVVDAMGGPMQIRAFDVRGKARGLVHAPPNAELEAITQIRGPSITPIAGSRGLNLARCVTMT